MQPSELLTTAEAARLLGITRRQVLDLAAANPQFPTSQAAVTGGRAWPRAGIQAWAAAHPSTDPVFTGPKVPPVPHWPPQVRQVMTFAAKEASALNHPWDDLDHLVLGMLHADCPGAARAVLESFGARAEPLRQALIDSQLDEYRVSLDATTPESYAQAERAARGQTNDEIARALGDVAAGTGLEQPAASAALSPMAPITDLGRTTAGI